MGASQLAAAYKRPLAAAATEERPRAPRLRRRRRIFARLRRSRNCRSGPGGIRSESPPSRRGSPMSETNAQEPTMEEILASIRRIISEDDAPQAAASEASPPEPQAVESRAEPAHVPEPPAVHAPPEEDVLELTDPVDPPPAPRA